MIKSVEKNLRRKGQKIVCWRELGCDLYHSFDLSVWWLDGLRFYLYKSNMGSAVGSARQLTFKEAVNYYVAHKDTDAYWVDHAARFRLNYQSPMYL